MSAASRRSKWCVFFSAFLTDSKHNLFTFPLFLFCQTETLQTKQIAEASETFVIIASMRTKTRENSFALNRWNREKRIYSQRPNYLKKSATEASRKDKPETHRIHFQFFVFDAFVCQFSFVLLGILAADKMKTESSDWQSKRIEAEKCGKKIVDSNCLNQFKYFVCRCRFHSPTFIFRSFFFFSASKFN